MAHTRAGTPTCYLALALLLSQSTACTRSPASTLHGTRAPVVLDSEHFSELSPKVQGALFDLL
jgi:hypothetical protein